MAPQHAARGNTANMVSAGFLQFKFPVSLMQCARLLLSLQGKFKINFKIPGLSAKQNYFSPSSLATE